EWRLFIFTGFLGGFTTFSTFTRETAQLFRVGEWKTALVYAGLSNIIGVALVLAGYYVSRRYLLST
ncbi:MAG: CrcB family protein, partial [Desulfurivibrionaceae bacterium]